MSLVFIAIGVEVYQVVAHFHCASGRALPASHRSTRGFGAAILADALCYFLAGACLHAAHGPWPLLLLPFAAHIFYWCLVTFFRSFYLAIHDYRLQTIYADGSFCRAKRIAGIFDTAFHLLAVVLLARHAAALPALGFAAAGVVAYVAMFVPAPIWQAMCMIRECSTTSSLSTSPPSIIRRSPSLSPPPSRRATSR